MSLSETTNTPQNFDAFACALDGIHLIEASAGTGKTWNICALYLRLLLEEGFAVQEILVVTFTRAATAELKQRIRARLAELSSALAQPAHEGLKNGDVFIAKLLEKLQQQGHSGEQIAQRLRDALQAFDEAAIFTIHGYCQRALADTPFSACQPFEQSFGEGETGLYHEVARDFWRQHLMEDSLSPLLGACLLECRDNPETWAALLEKVLAHPLGRQCWPEEATPATSAALTSAELAWRQAVSEAKMRWQQAGAEGKTVEEVLLQAMTGNLHAGAYKTKSVTKAAQAIQSWFACEVIPLGFDEDLRKALSLFSVAGMQKKKLKNATLPRHAFFDCADAVLSRRDALERILLQMRLDLLRRFLDEAPAQLQARKRKQRSLGFDDILHNVYQALHGDQGWLAAALQQRYPVALIDEFQDTDPLQFAIFQRVYNHDRRHGRLFLVGDPKQAIYGFRNADLEIYLYARRQVDSCYTLRNNQRSDGRLIKACNSLFAANRKAFLLERLDYVAVGVGEKPRQVFVDASETNASLAATGLRVWCSPSSELLTRKELKNAVVAATAEEIVRLIRAGSEGLIRIGEAALTLGDIAVLVRSHNEGKQMRAALAARGVGSVELSQQSVFASAEAEALEQFLQAVYEPMRLSRLRMALATPLMGFDAAGLEDLRNNEASLQIYLERFAAWHRLWCQRGLAVMLRQWMVDAQVAVRLLQYQDGERRLTNLLHLIECLHELAQHEAPDSLLRWLAQRRHPDDTQGQGEAAQLRLESDRNLVQIVTVHRAKGLEYGVVFCPFLWDGRRRSQQSNSACVIYPVPSADDGPPQRLLDFRPEVQTDEAVKAAQHHEEDAESLRLFYVALTRAVYRCYLVAACYNKGSQEKPSTNESCRSLLNWLAAGDGLDYAHWRSNDLKVPQVVAAWQSLAKTAGGCMSLQPLPEVRTQRSVVIAPPATVSLLAWPPPQRLPQAWSIGSFSGLLSSAMRGQDQGEPRLAQDHDVYVSVRQPESGEGIIAKAQQHVSDEDDFLRFPRGPAAGDCVHALFERVDFTDSSSHAPAIASCLHQYPQRLDNAELSKDTQLRLTRMLQRLLDDVLSSRLADDIVLSTVAPEQCVRELGFTLSSPRFDAVALHECLQHHGYAVPRLAFLPYRYLRGFIDLVFAHKGRFYLLDWKSNYLGDQPAAYAQAQLVLAMQHHGYHLQHLLYAVALHRHLRNTLAGYEPQRHWGGALYLFVRGVRPDWQHEGQPCGVYHHRVSPSLLERLDRLLGGEG